jgi:hypothetical protein
MAKISRQRGATYEREVAKEIFENLGVRIKRNLVQYQEANQGDLLLGDYLIECKRRRKIAVYEWMDQAEAACRIDQTPIVAMRADGEESLAVMYLSDLLKLLREEIPPDPEQDSPQGED